jgi:hypothetical protein
LLATSEKGKTLPNIKELADGRSHALVYPLRDLSWSQFFVDEGVDEEGYPYLIRFEVLL